MHCRKPTFSVLTKGYVIFYLYHLCELSYIQIAERLGCKVSTVGAHLHEARRRLQNDPHVRARYIATTED
jgi:DNA-directed RNA polymerase specialized sigma24 family protein